MNLPHIEGEIYDDRLYRTIYSTDASAYRELPLGVAFPKHRQDIITLIHWAKKSNVTLIPRAAGTSLAGQVVGDGLIVDISRHMNHILEINTQEKWVRCEPGVVLDELNLYTKAHGLFFAPETSTSNRCCVGGMTGNNSCGSHSLRYGSTRDHLVSAKVVLSDGSEVIFEDLTNDQVNQKCAQQDLEGSIYKYFVDLLSKESNQEIIKQEYPDERLTRRNNGYALDELLRSKYFDSHENKAFNLCRILAGSEGTLAFITELKLNLEPLPPKEKAVICVHCNSLDDALYGNLIARKFNPVAIELMDKTVLDLSAKNISQKANRFFIQGDPAAILIIELAEESTELIETKVAAIENAFRKEDRAYAFPCLRGESIQKVWSLRKAGLGLLANMVGDSKPVSVVEDTAVVPERLPDYIHDFESMLLELNLKCVYHAHIGTGELHLRPILNLKNASDKILFREVATRTALLVKKHRGSLSGEHGDGRLRGEFLPLMLGNIVYQYLCEIKHIFDPNNTFNKGKIVETPPMDQSLRYVETPEMDKVNTYFNYEDQAGWMRSIERCNGAADCRKSIAFDGGMCPAFRVTGEETDTTRARANALRELMQQADAINFNDPDILFVLKNCLSCKACKSECPSSVDMTRLKAEYMQHHYEKNGTPLSVRLVASLPTIQRMASCFPLLYNIAVRFKPSASIIRRLVHFTNKRPLPTMSKQTLRGWIKKQKRIHSTKKLYLFIDEFTNYLDVEVGQSFVKLLTTLGYEIKIVKHPESGRTALSKGMLKKAQKVAQQNVAIFSEIISSDIPLVGLEPSTLLSFRDEYPDLVNASEKKKALDLAKNVLLYDEFIMREFKKDNIKSESFICETLSILLHGHCHQKSVASIEPSKEMLEIPLNYSVEKINTGCCGMAGAYGYEKEHYETSMAIGEQVLFPKVRHASNLTQIAAPGTSCRTQIEEGTGRKVLHPVEILYQALK